MKKFTTLFGLKSSQPSLQEKEVVLIIVDIVGYTEYMLSTQTALLHGQTIINKLILSIIEQVRIPLKVAKLEGDAVFLYAAKEDNDLKWANTCREIGKKLPIFIEAFSQRLQQIEENTHCTCDACSNINKLGFKAVVHSGSALFYKIDNFLELAGIDVIVVHRLLKNSVKFHEYILMTDVAFGMIPTPKDMIPQKHQEVYPAIGTVATHIFPIRHQPVHSGHHEA